MMEGLKMKNRILLGLGLMLLLVGAVDSVSPILTYHPPTEINDTIISENHTQINMSIVEENLDTFKFNLTGPRNVSSVFYDDSLVLALNFNNNSAIGENSSHLIDISKYGNNGTFKWNVDAASGPTNSGRFGGGFMLDGDYDYITCEDDESLDITTELTVAVWFKPDRLITSEYLVAKWNTTNQRSYALQQQQDEIKFMISSDGTNPATTTLIHTTALTLNWHYVVGTFQGTTMRIYLDGIEGNNNATVSQIFSSDSDLLIGCTDAGCFEGVVDELRIYNRSLTPDEIWMQYQSEFQKYNSTEYRFYTNLTNLMNGRYQHFGWANDTAGNNGTSEVRTITIGRGYVHTFHLSNIVPEDGSLTVEYQPTAGTSSVSVDGTLLGSLDGTSPDTFTIPKNKLQSTTNIEYILPPGINVTQSNLTYTRYTGCEGKNYESCQHLQNVGSGIGDGLEISTVLIILIAAGGLITAISYFGGGDSI